MKKGLFASSADIDVNYLESTYGHDPETAGIIFSGYLQRLPSMLSAFDETMQSHNIYTFRELICTFISSASNVGLTKVSDKLQELNLKCVTAKDLVLYEIEIREIIKRIISSSHDIEEIKERLAVAS